MKPLLVWKALVLLLVMGIWWTAVTHAQSAPTTFPKPPPCFSACVNSTDVLFAQALGNMTAPALTAVCSQLKDSMGGWDGCSSSANFLLYVKHAIADGMAGLCNSPVSQALMESRYGVLINTTSNGMGYYTLCQPCNMGLLLNCSRVDCKAQTCYSNEVCLDFPNAVCWCNVTGTLVNKRCNITTTTAPPSATVIITPPPTKKPAPTESLETLLQQRTSTTLTYVTIGLGVGLLVIALVLYGLVKWHRPLSRPSVVVTFSLCLFSLLTSVILCYSLWTNGVYIPTSSDSVRIKLAIVQTISIMVSLGVGVGLGVSLIMQEIKNEPMFLIFRDHPSFGAVAILVSVVDPPHIKIFTSEIHQFLAFKFMPKTLKVADWGSFTLFALRDLPQLAIQLTIVTIAPPSAIPLLALIASAVVIMVSLGRRLTNLVLWEILKQKTRAERINNLSMEQAT